jgi:FtsH-binding integral membrane protein
MTNDANDPKKTALGWEYTAPQQPPPMWGQVPQATPHGQQAAPLPPPPQGPPAQGYGQQSYVLQQSPPTGFEAAPTTLDQSAYERAQQYEQYGAPPAFDPFTGVPLAQPHAQAPQPVYGTSPSQPVYPQAQAQAQHAHASQPYPQQAQQAHASQSYGQPYPQQAQQPYQQQQSQPYQQQQPQQYQQQQPQQPQPYQQQYPQAQAYPDYSQQQPYGQQAHPQAGYQPPMPPQQQPGYQAPPQFPPHGALSPYPQYNAQAHAAQPAAAPYGYGAPGGSVKTGKTAKASKKADKPGKPGRPIGAATATAGVSDRTRFIRLTYLHLLLAILAFAGLEWLLMNNPFLVEKVSIPVVQFALGGRWNWGIVLAVFMVVSWVADYWARHASSRGMQYAGLGLYVIAEAIIFVPLLAIVQWKTAEIIAKGGGDPNIIRDSAFTTLGIFSALTLSVFITKKDFSFLRSGLMMASGAALMLIVLSLVFGFNLGIVFSVAMVLLAAGYILFQTSEVLAHYDPRNYVAAALALFSSVALMFWYVIRIFMRARE